MDLSQHNEIVNRETDCKPREPDAPMFPDTHDLLTRQSMPSASPPQNPMRGLDTLQFGTSRRVETKEEAPTQASSALCMSSDYPVQDSHYIGVYLYQEYPMCSWGLFGASNPPSSIWTAYYRVQEQKNT